MINSKYDWKVVPLNAPDANKSKKIEKKKKKSKCHNAVVVDSDSLSF